MAKKIKEVQLFYDNQLYKFFTISNKKDAQEWMRKETQLMPVTKRHLYYFIIPSMMRNGHNYPNKRKLRYNTQKSTS